MAESSNIEWTDSTFNPWIGCTPVSLACDGCYAARSTPARAMGIVWGSGQPRHRTSDANWNQPLLWEKHHEAFDLAHGRRRRVFCASLADVFDNEVPEQWRVDLFGLIAATPNLDWLLLTKRIGNVLPMLRNMGASGLPRNIWLGVSIVTQAEGKRDIPKLLAVSARVRFLSIEPMLGPITINPLFIEPILGTSQHGQRFIDWVICGGESGPNARPMHPDWARSLRDQCAAAGVPYLFKQWGEWVPRGPESMGYPIVDGVPRVRLTEAGQNGQDLGSRGGNDVWMNRAGKKAAGRLLDGVEHNGFPVVGQTS